MLGCSSLCRHTNKRGRCRLGVGGGGMEGGQNVEENEKGLGGWRWGVHEEQEESAKQ